MAAPIDIHPQVDAQKNAAFLSHRGRYRPSMLVIETVNICNNDCVFCAYSAQTRARKTMEMSLFTKVIDDYVKIGGGCLSMTPVVGDVFLDKKLVERIEYLRRFPEITSLSATTNAVMTYLWDAEDLQFILRNINHLQISIYGIDDEEYRVLTRTNTYAKMIAGIRRILDGFDGVLNFGFRFLKDRSRQQAKEWTDEVRQGTRYQGEIGIGMTRDYANWGVLDTSTPLPLGARWIETPNNTRQCAIPIVAAQVHVSGNVSFCAGPDFDGHESLSLGDARDEFLGDILNNARTFRLWDWATHGVPEFCKNCSYHVPIDVLTKSQWMIDDPVRQVGG